MRNDTLLKRAGALGFPLFENEGGTDANKTLAEMAVSGDLRLWEGFPVVLAHSAERGLFNYKQAGGFARKPADRRFFVSLAALSLALYRSLALKFSWAAELLHSLPPEGKREYDGYLKKLKLGAGVNVAGRKVSGEKLKTVFRNYFNHSQERLSELLSVKDELNLEYSLSQLFSPKQKELFLKKLKGEKMTKTEREYFSRAVKKKVLALSNPELHRLSQRLLG